MKTILLLRLDLGMSYIVDHLIPEWRASGHIVVEKRDLKNLPPADLVFLHIDRTVVPDAYLQKIRHYPVVINLGAVDISRRHYSTLKLNRGDDYAGPVIIKTDENYGGVPELSGKRHQRNLWDKTLGKVLRYLSIKRINEPSTKTDIVTDWSRVESIDPLNYPIFESLRDVPGGVWDNPALLVERFMPEIENGLYYVRFWTFLGDQSLTGRFGSSNPIVKFRGMETVCEVTAPPPELRAWREKLKLDYGRFDYVVHDGKTFLLDVNKTQSGGRLSDEPDVALHEFARGIETYLVR